MTKEYLLNNLIIEYQRGGKYTNPFMSERLSTDENGQCGIVITNEPIDINSEAIVGAYNMLNSLVLVSNRTYTLIFDKEASISVYCVSNGCYIVKVMNGANWTERKSRK